jgi:hypothetical protein
VVIYLLADMDDRRDPLYEAYTDCVECLTAARQAVDMHQATHKDMKTYKQGECNECIFSENGEERWHVTVHEVRLHG